MDVAVNVEKDRPSLASLSGWGHSGFHAPREPWPTLGLLALLIVPFILDIAFIQGRPRHINDIVNWRNAAIDFFAPPVENIYAEHPAVLYPPFWLTIYYPLTLVSQTAAIYIYEVIKWVVFVVALRCGWRLVSPVDEDPPPVVTVTSLLMTARFLENDFSNGNVNVHIIALIFGACWLVRHQWRWAAGFVLSVGVAIKLTPALFIVYFGYKREWRTAVAAILGTAILLLVVPVPFVGWQANWTGLQDWHRHVVEDYVESGQIHSLHTNQSVVALMNRLFGPSVGITASVHDPQARYITIVELSQRGRDVLRYAIVAGTMGLLAWCCRGRLDAKRRPLAFAAEVSLVLIAMLMFSGFSWKATFVSMLLPYAVLIAYLADVRYTERRRFAAIALAVSFAFGTLTCDIITPTGANYAEAFGLILASALVAGIGMIVIRAQLRESTPG